MPKSRHTPRYSRLLQALKAARLAAGLTQTQVGEHFGAHASYISKCESGERRLDVIEVADLCKLYGVKVAALLKQVGIE